MCVKTRRIDVARVCLGHMAIARAARAIRRTIELKELPELQIARLAIELGMNVNYTRKLIFYLKKILKRKRLSVFLKRQIVLI